jgi:hypothetical protein
MTRRSIFQTHKIVLAFNRQRVLVAMFKSLNSASQTMSIPAQSISHCCLGHHISCFGYYFRHYDIDQVEVTPHLDFGTLRLEEYDRMLDLERRYHAPRELNRRRMSAEKRRSKTKTITPNEQD